MKKWLSTCFAAICISSSLQAQLENETLKLWYDGPATQWVEALPLGNGRIGAMVFGDPVHEQFQLNEETVWGRFSLQQHQSQSQRRFATDPPTHL